MNILWVFYDKHYQKIEIESPISASITIGPEIIHTLTISKFPFEKGPLQLNMDENEMMVTQSELLIGRVKKGEIFQFENNGATLRMMMTSSFTKKETYYIGYEEEISFSKEGSKATFKVGSGLLDSSLASSFQLVKRNSNWIVEPGISDLYMNGAIVEDNTPIELGDILFHPFIMVRLVEQDMIEVNSFGEFEISLPITYVPQSEMSKKYPVYRRTPRMMYELPNDKVNLSFPTQENDDTRRSLWITILPPLVMLIVMGIVTLIQPRGIFIIVSMVMFITTLVTSTVNYFKDKSIHKQRKERRYRVYKKYLEHKRSELQNLAERQKNVLTFHFPTFERMKYLTSQISDRIWERSVESHDFLQFRLGTGTIPASYEVSSNAHDLANREIDDLIEQSQKLETEYREVKKAPIVADLSLGSIGLIGKETVVKNELQQIIGQLAFFHSYHDIRFVFIFDESEYKSWEWVKWLPHFQLPHTHAKGLIYNEKTRDQLLSSIYELIRERDLDENPEKMKYMPHLVFIVTNQQLITDHVILEYLEGEHRNLGLSVIFAADAKESLTDKIQTLVRYINDHEGDILIKERMAVNIPFKLDRHHYEDNEKFARLLRTLDHQMGMTNSIPMSVSFLSMLNAKEVGSLPIRENWLTRESAKSLAVPIGLKGKEDIAELNLHEKAHGPHGLLAGTTGSGKSEFLQTYILSLAVHFHPHEVAFLLIDYKGGGMAQPFKNIPHLLGTITNIEGSKNFSARALASIRSELKRRQRLFDQYQVNHINDYTRLYKNNAASEPLPHLFLISDEFAELKSEEPEFIKELVSAARIGRSLGVHLILATQKPGGVIDDQIWSNARFRVALKVQDVSDSREILKNGDAAAITVTGRGYLQVGNNEVYELFQSAWSGAQYLEDNSESEDEVAFVTDLGLIPISEVAASTSKKKEGKTEIDAVVEAIEEIQKDMGIEKLNSPWLPPLRKRITTNGRTPHNQDEILFAMIDEPEKQSQTPYLYQVIEDGNIGIFGSSGYGKSYSVMTLLLAISEQYSPEEVNFYQLDFGNGSLLPLKQLPHTADFFLMDDHRKIEKFSRLMKEEIAKRKLLFQEQEVSNIKLFNAMSVRQLPLLFITIENFDLVKDEMPDFEALINQLARDGQSLGIFIILTATRINNVRQALMNNLKTKVVHYLMDSSEAYTIVGRMPYKPEAIAGRALIKKEDTHFSQVFLPGSGEDDVAILESIRRRVVNIKEKYSDCKKPKSIPMLPNELTIHNFKQYIGHLEERRLIPIGLEEEFVQPISVDFTRNKHCVILGPAQKGKTNTLKIILDTALEKGASTIGIFDSFDRGLSNYMDSEHVDYMETKEQIIEWLGKVEPLLRDREQDYTEMIRSGQKRMEYSPVFLVIDGYIRFSQTLDNTLQDRISKMMKNYSHLGFNVIVSGSNNDLTKGYDPLTSEIKQIRQAVLLMRKSDQTFLTLPYERREEEIHPGFGYYVSNGKEVKIQIPLWSIERKVYA